MGNELTKQGGNGLKNSADPLPDRMKVLIIDDEPVDREIFKQFLDEDMPGVFCYAESGTGRSAVDKIETFRPDCILLDFSLPDMDGLKMIRLLLDGREYLPCAVVMLTGTGNEKVAVEAMKLGVMDYVAKGPSSAFGLSRTVAGAVQRFRFQEEIVRQRAALEQRNKELETIRAELYEEKERYRLLAEAIPQLVWTADSNGRVHYGNQRLRVFSGKAITGTGLVESLVHPDDRAGFRQNWTEAVSSGEAFEYEMRLRRAEDRTWRWHLMRAVPIASADADLWFGTFTDIEDQKRAETALRRREKLDSIGVLAGGIAHDFNNLLAGIMGGASFALNTIDPGHAAYSMLEIVVRSSEKAAVLTQQLLAYAGQLQAFPEPSDIPAIIHAGCDLVRNSIPASVQLTIESASGIPAVATHSRHLEQVIANLVINAAEAIGSADGWIKVQTALKTIGAPSSNGEGESHSNVLGYELPEGEYISIEVSDSGPGIEEQMLARIFDPFFTTKFTGRGLGLAVVHGVVRSLRGGLHVTSAPGAARLLRGFIAMPIFQHSGVNVDGLIQRNFHVQRPKLNLATPDSRGHEFQIGRRLRRDAWDEAGVS